MEFPGRVTKTAAGALFAVPAFFGAGFEASAQETPTTPTTFEEPATTTTVVPESTTTTEPAPLEECADERTDLVYTGEKTDAGEDIYNNVDKVTGKICATIFMPPQVVVQELPTEPAPRKMGTQINRTPELAHTGANADLSQIGFGLVLFGACIVIAANGTQERKSYTR